MAGRLPGERYLVGRRADSWGPGVCVTRVVPFLYGEGASHGKVLLAAAASLPAHSVGSHASPGDTATGGRERGRRGRESIEEVFG